MFYKINYNEPHCIFYHCKIYSPLILNKIYIKISKIITSRKLKLKYKLSNRFFFLKIGIFVDTKRQHVSPILWRGCSWREAGLARQDTCQMSRFISNNKPTRADTRDVWALYNVQHNMIQLCAEQCWIRRARLDVSFRAPR